jgi:hypothetical protein
MPVQQDECKNATGRGLFTKTARIAVLTGCGSALLFAAAFPTYFPATSEFSQEKVINAVLAKANSEANLKGATKDGICAMVTIQWLIQSIAKGGGAAGFAELTKQDVTKPAGMAFWTQMLGGFKAYIENTDGLLSAGSTTGRRSEIMELLSRNQHKLKVVGAATTATEFDKLIATGGPYFYLAVITPQGGHAIGVERATNGEITLEDPNYGLTAAHPAGPLFTDMVAAYHASKVYVLEVVKV